MGRATGAPVVVQDGAHTAVQVPARGLHNYYNREISFLAAALTEHLPTCKIADWTEKRSMVEWRRGIRFHGV